jgi:hypothetical protein
MGRKKGDIARGMHLWHPEFGKSKVVKPVYNTDYKYWHKIGFDCESESGHKFYATYQVAFDYHRLWKEKHKPPTAAGRE